MSTSNAIFTGTSQFSTDFQNVITRAVSIASLPISLLNTDLADLNKQSTALTGLDTKFAALQSAIQGIGDALSGPALQVDVSNPDVIGVSTNSGASEGIYSVEVKDIGAYSTTLTKSWVNTANPPGQTHTYKVTIGTDGYDVTPSDNSAATVAAAINAKVGDKVRATAVNVGSSASPDWRLSLQSTTLATDLLDIQDGATSLHENQTAGWQAQYVVNGSGKTVESSSRTVSIAAGVSVQLLSAAEGTPVDISVTRSTSALSDALTALVTAYNDAVDAVGGQQGTAGGALQGNSVVRDLQSALSGLVTYSASGNAVAGLASLGLDLDKTGKLTFNPFTLMTADISDSSAVNAFLGSASGGGFLKAATGILTGIEDSSTGLLKTAEASIQTRISDTNEQIATKQDQVDQLQTRLNEQMAAADAAIAAMEQQYSYLASMFQAMQSQGQQYN